MRRMYLVLGFNPVTFTLKLGNIRLLKDTTRFMTLFGSIRRCVQLKRDRAVFPICRHYSENTSRHPLNMHALNTFTGM